VKALPVPLDLADRRCSVAGGGAIAGGLVEALRDGRRGYGETILDDAVDAARRANPTGEGVRCIP
jgi:hypothetical protein